MHNIDMSAPGQLTMPNEVFISNDAKYTFIFLKSSIVTGKMHPFGKALTAFVEAQGFSQVVVLSSTGSPVKRERESNRELPELFAYVNNYLYKKCIAEGTDYYSKHSIRRFGFWLGSDKKHAH